MSIREKFVKAFSEKLACKLEVAGHFHANNVNSKNKGTDEFKWVLLICIGYQCFEKDRFRKYHKIDLEASFGELKAWIINEADLASHDGDMDYIAFMAGVYSAYIPK